MPQEAALPTLPQCQPLKLVFVHESHIREELKYFSNYYLIVFQWNLQ